MQIILLTASYFTIDDPMFITNITIRSIIVWMQVEQFPRDRSIPRPSGFLTRNTGHFGNLHAKNYAASEVITQKHKYGILVEGRDMTSSFGEKTSSGETMEWFPSHNIVVRNSHFEEIGGNGMVIRVAEAPLVEHNLFIRNGTLTTGKASYPYNCDNALWQFNEACYTVYNEGDADASGFDSDYFCKNTIIQYNYSHDNEWGSLLVTSNGNISRAFNEGTIIRYNIFQSDKHHSIRVSGKPTNTYVYNNIMYFGEDQSYTDIIWHKSWGSPLQKILFKERQKHFTGD